MQKLFQYNWQVGEDWFTWCESVSEEELLKRRTGGPGSILYTLFHIVDGEYSWICGLQRKPEPKEPPFEAYASLSKVREFSKQCHKEVEPFVMSWTNEMESKVLADMDANGKAFSYTYGEIMRHLIAHEIHHIGQLSVWSRELNQKPVTANLIGRRLFDQK